MANTFKLKTKAGVTSAATIYTVPSTTPDTTTILIGLTLANVHASANADCSVQITTASTSGENADNPYIIKTVPVPFASTLEIMEGKIVMNEGDVLAVTSTQTVDVALSILEQT